MTTDSSNTVDISIHQSGHLKSINVIKEINGYILTGAQDGKISVWDSELQEEVAYIYAHNAAITTIEWIPKTKILITGSTGTNFHFWSWGDFKLLETRYAHASSIIAIKRVGDTIYSAGRDNMLKKWQIKGSTLKEVRRTRIPHLDEIFVVDDIIIVSCNDGMLSVYDSNDLSFVKYLDMRESQVIKAIKRASKFIRDFRRRDPYAILMRIRRQNGIPATTCAIDTEHIILGHFFGLITIWRRKDLTPKKVFFAHSNHISGLYCINSQLYSTALDSKLAHINYTIKRPAINGYITLSARPITFLSTSTNEYIIGFENGEVSKLDKEFELINSQPSPIPFTSACLSKESIIGGTQTGEIKVYEYKSLRHKITKKISEKAIIGLFAYRDKVAIISEDAILKLFDHALDEKKELTLPVKKEKLKPKDFGRYIVLTKHRIFDFHKNEVIKGEVSEATMKEKRQNVIHQFKESVGDLILTINKDKLTKLVNAKDYSFYSKHVLEGMVQMIEKSDELGYMKSSENAYITADFQKTQIVDKK